ncbi:hypothetical protein L486_08196 [Kwoniella mangroviensis CBS 10435]|uniref:SnoaL-like domain-containing protein n=1 Tax=Kwoniella mangroviensis CBS 10435 TaxID=1331196 RepID=A0A1B9IFJ8_9TREE|nr:hypothetical protein L486_08196 [Kwoniella mangroviensis CBS 10435]
MPVKESYVQELIQLQLNGDWPTLMTYIRDDVEWMVINPLVKSTPLSGLFHGKEEYAKTLTPLFSTFEDRIKFNLERLTVVNDLAIVEMKGQAVGAKDKKEFVGFWLFIYELEEEAHDGEKPKIKGIKEYLDSALIKEFIENNL